MRSGKASHDRGTRRPPLLTPREPAFAPGEELYYIGCTVTLPSGNRLAYGWRGEALGPGQDDDTTIEMRFRENDGGTVDCRPESLSRSPPALLPGGFEAGERLFYTGSTLTLPQGRKVLHGWQGEVAGLMERNDYANDLPSPLILSKYLKIQSQAFIQVLNVNYSRIILATKELRTINATSCPEQFAASNSCMMEVFRWLAVYHGGQAASYRRQLKIMLENVNGLLSQKPSVASIRQVLKDVVICGSALGKHIGGRSYTQSIIVARGNVSP